MPAHVVKRGLDIPIQGAATGQPIELAPPASAALSPEEYRGVFPKLHARVGDSVEEGGVLFFNKRFPEMNFRSPIPGKVVEIRRGKRRVITDYVVERDGEAVASLQSFTLAQLEGISRDEARTALLASGMWQALRTRPLSRVAEPDQEPQYILVSATETGPLQPGAAELLSADDAEALQAGIYALRALTDGGVAFAAPTSSHPAWASLKGVDIHTFKGPHPAGDPAVQVNLVKLPVGAGFVWYARAWDVALIGKALLQGRFPAERIYAVTGAGAPTPRLVRTVLGAPLADLAGATPEGMRWIRGSVLTGDVSSADRWAGFYARGLHLLPEEIHREFWGWIMPQFAKHSFHRALAAGLLPMGSKRFDLRPVLFGGRRAMVPNPAYARMVATPDIQPEFLFRSILAGDLEDSIGLGLLDISEEEAALMTYICPAKIEYGVALRGMLDTYVKET